jgi:hypothetical protein
MEVWKFGSGARVKNSISRVSGLGFILLGSQISVNLISEPHGITFDDVILVPLASGKTEP